MSIRTLVELNHDYSMDSPDFLVALGSYLRGGDRESGDALERFGVRVISQRHHSGKFYVPREPDGFPLQIVSVP